MATSRMISDLQRPGQVDHAARGGGEEGRERYWPSTPMLNRFIRKPMATASAGQVVASRPG